MRQIVLSFALQQATRCVIYVREKHSRIMMIMMMMIRMMMLYLLTAIGLTPGGSSTVHIYTQTVHRTTQLTTEQNN